DLERHVGTQWRLVRSRPPASALANGAKSLRLDLLGCNPAVDLPACYIARVRPVTRSAAVVSGRGWTAPNASASPYARILQYWVLYAVNDWRNSRTKPTAWQLHEGDWEFVSVALDASGKPVSVAYGQHDLGVRRPWTQARKTGTHPTAYVALGSHATYARSGLHTIPKEFSGVPLSEPDFTAAETSYGPAGLARTPLGVVHVSSGTAPWLTFAGAWGDGNYIIVGYSGPNGFRASTRLHAGDSPPGPAFHGIWRAPLEPFRSWPPDDDH